MYFCYLMFVIYYFYERAFSCVFFFFFQLDVNISRRVFQAIDSDLNLEISNIYDPLGLSKINSQ